MKKKVITILLLIGVLISLMPNPFIYAVEPKTTITVHADKTQAKPGDEITYSIQISAKEAVGSIMLTLDIPEGLTYVPNSGALATNFTEVVGNLDEADYTETEKLITIAHRSPFAINGTVTLATFKCRANGNATGNYTVGLKDVEVTVGENYDILPSNECNIISSTVNIDTSIDTTSTFKTSITSTKKELNIGDEFEVNINVGELKNIEKGFIALSGQLDYDKNVLERMEITKGDGTWNPILINDKNFKFITDAEKFVTETANVFTIKFKVKDNITVPADITIGVKNMQGSNGISKFSSNNTELKLSVVEKKEDFITSEKYLVENDIISKIVPDTTVAELKKNINASQEIIITDKDGRIINEDQKVGTKMKLKVGQLERTLVVTGDIDGDCEINIADIAKLKLHLIDLEKLTGIEANAADIDGEGQITLVDLAQMKLVIIGLFVI